WQYTQRSLAEADESEFAALLWAIVQEVPELARLRYTSPHPRHLTRALIEAHHGIAILAKHLHLPVQSGNNQMLRRMLRRYTREEYLERVTLLKQSVPGLTLSTDIIVGFPGETATQFNDTLTLVDELAYTGLFGFKYSPRPFTPALKLADDIPECEKSERLEAVFARHDLTRRKHLDSLIGTTQDVLIEGRKPDGAFTGRTARNEIVHLASLQDITGQIAKVRIALAFKNSLAAELLDESLRVSASALPRLAQGSEPVRVSDRDPRSPIATARGGRQLPVV
ncbi:MAG TPA: radical SAM protein, partial [Polyangiaceae bacterium]